MYHVTEMEVHSKSDFDQPLIHLHLSFNEMEDLSGNKIAESVLSQYELLPKKSKPLFRGGGIKEWVPMSGIVAQGAYLLSHLKFRLCL